MPNRTDEFADTFLNMFQQGAQFGGQAEAAAQQRALQQQQLMAAQQAQQFRQQLAQQHFDLDRQATQRQQEAFNFKRPGMELEARLNALRNPEAIVQSENENRGLDTDNKRADLSFRKAKVALLKQRHAMLEDARKSNKETAEAWGDQGPPKFTREEIVENPDIVFDRIDQKASEFQQKFKRKMPDSTYNKLRDDASKVAMYALMEAEIATKFKEMEKVTGIEGFGTALGSVPAFGRLFPELKKDAIAYEQMQGYLIQLSTQLQQSEPNSVMKQNMAMQLVEIAKLDSDDQMKARARFVIDILRSRRKESGIYLQGSGIMVPDTVPGATPKPKLPPGVTEADVESIPYVE